MDQYTASVVRRPWNVVTLPDHPGLVHPDDTLESVRDESDVTAQIELHRWEDDGGATVNQARRSPTVVADFGHVEAA